MRLHDLFAEKVRYDQTAFVYQPALVLFKKDGSKVEYSWTEYKQKTLQAMEGLKWRGLKPGEFVAIIALNLPESFFIMLGAILMGAIPVPINVMLLKEAGQQELRKILGDCRPTLVLGNQCLQNLLPKNCIPIEQIISEGKEHFTVEQTGKGYLDCGKFPVPNNGKNLGDMLIMLYTSGTTGDPKGVMLSEAGELDRVSAILNKLQASHQERVFSYLPLGHIAELVATFFGQIHSGYTIYFTEHIEDRLKNPKSFQKAFPEFLQKVQPTIFLGVPQVWTNIQDKIKNSKIFQLTAPLRKSKIFRQWLIKKIKKEIGFSETKIFITSAAPKDRIDIEFFQSLDIKIDDIYGQTETGGPILINGRPIGNVKAGIQNGEITIEGPCLMLGYYNNQEATKEVIREFPYEGYETMTRTTYHSGDLGKKGRTLNQWLESEFTEIIYTGRLGVGFKLANGEKIPDQKINELEDAIKKVEGVKEAIVCGEGKPYLVALVFYDDENGPPYAKTLVNVHQCIDTMGEGIYRVKKCQLISKKELILTPTMKTRRKALIERFNVLIDKMYNSTY